MKIKKGDRVIIHSPVYMKHLKNVECVVVKVNEHKDKAIVQVVKNRAFSCLCKHEYKMITLAKIHYERDSLIGMEYKIVMENLLLIDAREYFKEKNSYVFLKTTKAMFINEIYLQTVYKGE